MMSITYAEQILMSIMINSNLARTISEISPSLKRLLEIDEAELPANGTEVLEKVESITLDNVTKSYVENRPVVENLNLTLNSGDRIAIVGGTSGGKSTLAMLAAGLTDATAGAVKINGIDAADYDKQTLRERIALVGAYNNSIYSGTYVDNISLGRDIDREAVEKAAKAAEIDEFISSLDYGYDSLAYSSGNTISGGQRQRLMIARALAASPDVLILDDSTSSLDYSTEKKVLDNITSMYAGITLILITERAGSAASCDKSYTLEKGGLV
jgi:ATP-binding cassette subfamily B protein